MTEVKKVLMVSPEFYGDTMVGGLAMAVSGLANALQQEGIEVDVLMPSYIETSSSSKFTKKPYAYPDKSFSLDTSRVNGTTVHKVKGFGLRKPFTYDWRDFAYKNLPRVEDIVYRKAAQETFQAFHRFAAIISEAIKKLVEEGKDFDVIHLHEWMTAGASYWIRQNKKIANKPILVTSHNINYTGEVPNTSGYESDIPENSPLVTVIKSCLAPEGKTFMSLLEMGVFYADAFNTVSPSEAAEILAGRDSVDPNLVRLAKEKGLVGILNGIDPGIFNPDSDPCIGRYNTRNPQSIYAGKKDNKQRLQQFLRSKKISLGEKEAFIDPNKMLVSMMGRLVDQKSINETLKATEEIAKLEDVQMLLIGETNDGVVRNKVSQLCGNLIGYPYFAGPELQHLVLAASDAILMPSKLEPFGYTHLEGMVYGAVPIATHVGGLKDTIIPFNGEAGYGFIIKEPTPEGIINSIKETSEVFAKRESWSKAVMNAVAEDFTWRGKRNSVGKHIELYDRLIDLKKKA